MKFNRGFNSAQLTLVLSMFLCAQSIKASTETKTDPYANRTAMNDIQASDYRDFESTWKLVTVRYREDIHEQRFVYANPSAAKALKEGTLQYPDGAVFAKVSYVTERDTTFASSIIPATKKRLQLMVHNGEKYKTSQGWGYALFNAEGKTLNGEPSRVTQACVACHQIVQSRGYVFSEYMGKTPKTPLDDGTTNISQTRTFKKTHRADLPSALKPYIKTQFTHVYELTGPLQNNIFEGTLNEVLPTLIEKTTKERKPAVLIGPNAKLFSAAYLDNSSNLCPKGTSSIQTVRTIFDASDPDTTILKINRICANSKAQ